MPYPAAATLSAALLLVAPALAQVPDHPAYKVLRFDEDWSRFHPTPKDPDLSDSFKHVDLAEDGSSWVSFGGRLESRMESWNGFGFGAQPSNDDTFTLSRLLLHSDWTVGEHLRAYLEGISAQSTDRDLPGGRRTSDMDSLDLQQGWVDLKTRIDGGDTLRLRVGRQTFSFGAQRLVSAAPWGNTFNRWEGFTGAWTHGPWTVTSLATWFVPVNKDNFNLRDNERSLYGFYATRTPAAGEMGLDLYVLGDTRPNVTVNGTSGDERRHTLGARGWGPLLEHGDWELEGAWQTGKVGDSDVNAWFVSSVASWRPDAGALAPRLWIGLDAASGDDSPGGKVGTFSQLYPLGHAYFGYIDAVGRQNICAAQVGASIKPEPQTTISLVGHEFQLMETSDSLYAANGSASRNGFGSHHVGEEVDLLVQHHFALHFDMYGGYSHLFSGPAIADSGTSEDVDFLYLGAQLTF